MKIVELTVKDLKKFEEHVKNHNLVIEPGPHMVLFDHSELAIMDVKDSNGSTICKLVVHFITPYYRVDAGNVEDDDEYWRRLWEVKRSGEYWAIPVNPIIAVLIDESFSNIFTNYSDDYPVQDGAELVEKYRRSNPNYKRIPRVALARVLDGLS